jgi:hypothetical protein
VYTVFVQRLSRKTKARDWFQLSLMWNYKATGLKKWMEMH